MTVLKSADADAISRWFDRPARRDGRGVGEHLRDQRRDHRHRADGTDHGGGDVEEVAAVRLLRIRQQGRFAGRCVCGSRRHGVDRMN
jgi:hypothetical protein